MQTPRVTRRGFILGAATGLAGVALAACSGGQPTAAPTASSSGSAAQPTAAPTTAAAAAKPTAALATSANLSGGATATPAAAAQGATSTGKSVGGTVNWLVRTTKEENDGQAKVFEPAIKAAYPNIKINRIIVPSAQYIPKINSMAAAKESLEIWGFGGNYMDYWWRNLPQDLNSYISADKWNIQDYFLPGLSDIYMIDGKHWGLPQQPTYGSVLAYNKDMFDKAGLPYPPVDWDDTTWNLDKAMTYAEKMTANPGTPNGTYGFNLNLWQAETSLAYLWGGDSWLPEHYTNFIAPKTNFGSDANMQAHQFRHDMMYKSKVQPNPSVMQGMNSFSDPFFSGRIAMEADGGWLYWTLSDLNTFKFGYAAVPGHSANKVINFDDQWIMGRWSTNKDAAWAVMRVLTSPDATKAYSIMSGAPPAVASSKSAWIEQVSKHTGQSVADLEKVTSGAIVAKRSQESPDHLFLQFAKIDTTYNNEIAKLWNNPNASVDSVWSGIVKAMDDTVAGIYKEFNGTRPSS